MAQASVSELKVGQEETEFLDAVINDLPSELCTGHEAEVVDWVECRMLAEKSAWPQRFTDLEELLGTNHGVLVKGLALPNDLPETPSAYLPPERAYIYAFDVSQIALAAVVGLAYGARHIRGGRIVQDVFPKPGFEKKADSAFGAEEDFDFHADVAIQPDVRPDIFSLHCIRNSTNTPTLVSTVEPQELDPALLDVLGQPIFNLYWAYRGDTNQLQGVPIIEVLDLGRFQINYYGELKIDYDVEHAQQHLVQNALLAFKQQLQANAVPVHSQQGDILFVNNINASHARRRFKVSNIPQAERRWLRKLFIARRKPLSTLVLNSTHRVVNSNYIN